MNHDKFVFHKQGIGNGYGTLEEVKEDSMLKLDVEWNEWDAINSFSEEIIKNFNQIILEIHLVHGEMKDHLTPYFKEFYKHSLNKINDNLFKMYYEAMKKLTKYFYIFHIHANNSLPKITVNGLSFPPLIELSLVRKDLAINPRDSSLSFPVKGIDYPNKTDRADIFGYYPLGN
jgi:hypothetical protein